MSRSTIKLNDIFRCSWGYDQTNVDFYQVTRVVSDKTIEVKRIESKLISDSSVMPVLNEFIGDKLIRRPRKNGDRIYINGECSFMTASQWSGEPCYQTPHYAGH